MKIKFFYGLILILTSLSLGAEPAESSLPRPKLVVGIVVDQMRWDYLYRYYDRYGDRGFKRLLKEGFTCENTQLNYLPAFTAVGHTCIYTGSVPSVTGIAANDFYIEKEKKKLYCTADPTVECVGSDSQAGRMSPRNLWVTTITDELRLGTNFHSKVIGIALKDRAAILPAGHTANAAYWFDYDSGKWIITPINYPAGSKISMPGTEPPNYCNKTGIRCILSGHINKVQKTILLMKPHS